MGPCLESEASVVWLDDPKATLGCDVLVSQPHKRLDYERSPQPHLGCIVHLLLMLNDLDTVGINPVTLGAKVAGVPLDDGFNDVKATKALLRAQSSIRDWIEAEEFSGIRDAGTANGFFVLLTRLRISFDQDANSGAIALEHAEPLCVVA